MAQLKVGNIDILVMWGVCENPDGNCFTFGTCQPAMTQLKISGRVSSTKVARTGGQSRAGPDSGPDSGAGPGSGPPYKPSAKRLNKFISAK